ncbi:MAG: hypothetical protein AAGA72_13595 [Pseudomonadota bacterium]
MDKRSPMASSSDSNGSSTNDLDADEKDSNTDQYVRNLLFRNQAQKLLAENLPVAIVERLTKEGVIKKEDTVKRLRALGSVYELIDSDFPEIGQIDVLRTHYTMAVEKPSMPFKGSGLPLAEYIDTQFSRAVDRGCLPLDKVDERYLKQKVAVAKSRGDLPAPLSKICLTTTEVVAQIRQAFLSVIGERGQSDGDIRKAQVFARRIVGKEAKTPAATP